MAAVLYECRAAQAEGIPTRDNAVRATRPTDPHQAPKSRQAGPGSASRRSCYQGHGGWLQGHAIPSPVRESNPNSAGPTPAPIGCRSLRHRPDRTCITAGTPSTTRSPSCDLSVGCSSGASQEDGGCETNPAPQEPRMNPHKHARLSPRGRALMVDRIVVQGMRVEEAAHAAGVSKRTAYKWLRRFRQESIEGLVDRSSRPRSCP